VDDPLLLWEEPELLLEEPLPELEGLLLLPEEPVPDELVPDDPVPLLDDPPVEEPVLPPVLPAEAGRPLPSVRVSSH
jgi:hypothetical protein